MSVHRVWVYGDNVNTDVIFPGKYTYTLREPSEIAAHALEDLDPTFAAHAQAGDIIIGGRNWGMGSSREQAVTALRYAGVGMIIAESFGGLYFRNCINQGIRPVVLTGLRTRVQTGDGITVDLANGQIEAGGVVFAIPTLPAQVQAILDAGGLLPMLKARFAGCISL